ncbi:MerR family transcriptional regulator [Mycolicibacterium komossense]|uniref:MerR family transcriptional regulator n=1 Tax=Mycolicibacterium komossense TaxID=1779 RepID=A0ABT3C7X8_9MYCO|nr:MerR family transcriptional regulator [Mycolicibacterium komossense]MCV7225563.1 MerR family transcriptional regulator [Mycolicibacterium komossense]
MRIGELAERTGVAPRLLRYYEEQGLVIPRRSANGYREYDEVFVDQIIRIRGLLHAGLPVRVIRQVLPCLKAPRDIHFADATPEIIAVLQQERDRMSERIVTLTKNRDAISRYLSELNTCRKPLRPKQLSGGPTPRRATDRTAAGRDGRE